MQDYYELLQVHPKAEHETIQAAYERMRQRYEPESLEGLADELAEVAKQKRDELDRAYAILGDAERRAAYDAGLQAHVAGEDEDDMTWQVSEDDLIDYRPLPPANRQERPDDFNDQPYISLERYRRQRKQRESRPQRFIGNPAVIAALLTFIVGLTTLVVTGGGIPGQAPASSHGMGSGGDMPSADQLNAEFDSQITAARQAAEQVPENPEAWVSLGNTLFDSVQIIREHMPESESYQELIPRWLEASEAYSTALQLDPDNVQARADMAAGLCNYGAGIGDQSYVEQGLEQAREAVERGPENGRALLNLGTCLVSLDPPETEEAMKHWRKILVLKNPSQGIVTQAQRMLRDYGAGNPTPTPPVPGGQT